VGVLGGRGCHLLPVCLGQFAYVRLEVQTHWWNVSPRVQAPAKPHVRELLQGCLGDDILPLGLDLRVQLQRSGQAFRAHVPEGQEIEVSRPDFSCGLV
jgi:hypothetical protein